MFRLGELNLRRRRRFFGSLASASSFPSDFFFFFLFWRKCLPTVSTSSKRPSRDWNLSAFVCGILQMNVKWELMDQSRSCFPSTDFKGRVGWPRVRKWWGWGRPISLIKPRIKWSRWNSVEAAGLGAYLLLDRNHKKYNFQPGLQDSTGISLTSVHHAQTIHKIMTPVSGGGCLPLPCQAFCNMHSSDNWLLMHVQYISTQVRLHGSGQTCGSKFRWHNAKKYLYRVKVPKYSNLPNILHISLLT